VKDGLRDAPERMERLLGAWYACTTGCSTLALDEGAGDESRRNAAAEKGAGLLELLARYVDWIGLDLVVNERWVGLVFALAFPGSGMDPRGAAAPGAARTGEERLLQCGALSVVQAVVAKGMDVRAKVQLMGQLQLPRLVTEYVQHAVREEGEAGGRGDSGGDSGGDGMDDGDGAPGHAVALASLATDLASELLSCVDKLGDEDGSGVATECGAMLSRVMPAVLDAVRAGRDEISAAALPFVVAYVRRLARLRDKGQLPVELDAGSLTSLGAILGVIRDKLRLTGDGYDDENDADDEFALQEYRKELCIMLRNVVRLIPARSKLFMAGLIAPLLRGPGNRPSSPALNSLPWADVEVCVAMLYEIGEFLSDEVLRPHFPLTGHDLERAASAEGASAFLSSAVASQANVSLCDLVVLVVGYSDIEHYRHRAVVRTYLELLNRYYRTFARGSAKSAPMPPVDLLGRVLQIFLDDRGLKHEDPDIRSRASYLLMRLCKSLRMQLSPYADELLNMLGEVMVMKGFYTDAHRPTSAGRDAIGVGSHRGQSGSSSLPGLLTPEDQLHLFEAVGILVGLGRMPTEKQAHYLELILQPLMTSIDMCLKVGASHRSGQIDPVEIDPSYMTIDTQALLQHLISGAAFIAQGFGATLANDVTYGRGEMVRQTQLFKSMMELVLRALELEGGDSEGVRDAAMSFLHRMVTSLGVQVMPYMARVVDCLMGQQADPSVIKQFLLLVNQLCATFKREVAGMLDEVFLPVMNGIFVLLRPTDAGGDPAQSVDLASWSSSRQGGNSSCVPPVLLVNETNSIDANGKQLANTEEVRELRELQRGYFTHLHTIFTNSLSSVLLTERNILAVQPIFASLVVAGSSAKDMSTRRLCLQICNHALHDWMDVALDRVGSIPNTGEQDAVAGREHSQALLKHRPELVQWLRQFMVEEVVPTCCVRAPLDEAFDLADAKTDTLLGEIAHTLVVVYKLCGAEALNHLGNCVLPPLGCPESLANEFLTQVAAQDTPSLKNFLGTFIRKSHDRGRA